MPDESQYQYQDDFSSHSEPMHDSAQRRHKASKTIAVILDYLSKSGKDGRDLSLLDIGCSTGFMSQAYAQHFRHVTGVDIDRSAIEHAAQRFSADNVEFLVRDSMNMGFADNSYDVVTCTHIYEHVPDSCRLIAEIYRVLKPGGICYFTASNRLRLIEPHYNLPLLSVIPKRLAHPYMRWTGKGDSYYETHLTYWGLRRLVKDFELCDYTLEVVRDPDRFSASEMVREGSLKQRLANAVFALAYWICPSYIWILRKPV